MSTLSEWCQQEIEKSKRPPKKFKCYHCKYHVWMTESERFICLADEDVNAVFIEKGEDEYCRHFVER